ncbi:TPA: S26 family signal peptidase, partial [Escherichia coli]
GKSELLLMTDRSASSFDGRYFGAVTKSQIISTILPVMTW